MGTENEESVVEPVVEQTVVDEQPENRRDAIEAAFAEVEAAETNTDAEVTGEEKPLVGDKPKVADNKEAVEKTEVKPVDVSDKAPAGWKPDAKAKWGTVDPVIRAEVIRREREAAQIVSANDGARKFAGAVFTAAEPFKARLAAQGIDIPTAVHNLLRSDYNLSTGSSAQRAALMARMIKDYNVDINELDAALSGQVTNPVDQTEQRLLAAIDQRLAPVNRFLQGNQQQQSQAEAAETARLVGEVDNMEAQPEKYPHFNTVREYMADIIEMSANKGVYLTTEQAYNKACLVHPEVSERVIAQQVSEAARVAAVARDARARTALGASRSVRGNPAGVPTRSTPTVNDRRGTILAALEAHEGR